MNSLEQTIFLIRLLTSISLFVQTLELLAIRDSYSDRGVWRHQQVKNEFTQLNKILGQVLGYFLQYRVFVFLLSLRLIFAFLLSFNASLFLVLYLFIVNVLVCLRWRGVFNGGSDYVTSMVLLGLVITSISPSNQLLGTAVVFYLAVQICLSYFIAGVVKLFSKNWRTASALKAFVSSTIFEDNMFTKAFANSNVLITLSSWTIIVFELCFPFILMKSVLIPYFLAFAVVFHLLNFYIFGLNRFFFAWISCYPAIIYAAQAIANS